MILNSTLWTSLGSISTCLLNQNSLGRLARMLGVRTVLTKTYVLGKRPCSLLSPLGKDRLGEAWGSHYSIPWNLKMQPPQFVSHFLEGSTQNWKSSHLSKVCGPMTLTCLRRLWSPECLGYVLAQLHILASTFYARPRKQVVGPLSVGSPGWFPSWLALAWLSHSFCKHLRSQLLQDPSLSAFQKKKLSREKVTVTFWCSIGSVLPWISWSVVCLQDRTFSDLSPYVEDEGFLVFWALPSRIILTSHHNLLPLFLPLGFTHTSSITRNHLLICLFKRQN